MNGKLVALIGKLIAAPPAVRFSARGIAAQAKALEAAHKALNVPDEWAKHSEELARKATERGAAIVQRVLEDEIPIDAGAEALDALCEVTQGLIPHDAWQPLYDSLKEMRAL